MSHLEDLLRVQELDTLMDQLRYRRDHTEQIAAAADLRTRIAASSADLAVVDKELRRLNAAEREAEDHAAMCAEKAASIDASLYDGSVVAHKELESLQAEIVQLGERQNGFEEAALELMEEAAPVEADVEQRRRDIAELEGELAAVEADLVVVQTEIDVEIDQRSAELDQARSSVPAALLEAYDPLRRQLGGIAVARLIGARCDGCHLEIPAVDLDRIRHSSPEDVVTCPECMRILVH